MSSNPGEPGVSLREVKYNLSAHEAQVEVAYREIKRIMDRGKFKISIPRGSTTAEKKRIMGDVQKEVLFGVFLLSSGLFVLKSAAFPEEGEWRLLSFFIMGSDGEDQCSYRALDNRIVPYRKVELKSLKRFPIAEVVLGPRHITPVKTVEDFMKRNHFELVKVRRSEVSYR
jgi:hypothetical protein